ncbi:peptidoglycan-binding protein [Geobacillus thermoleovorans]|uniref:peptidoglycan-binding protein n=1 Tax=Geobacillus thermoleovorans TaxID=33941 RepID=UPI00165110AE|nr:peptidoglycan-binding protein [Geobacillus thermoleovorans]
MDYLEGQRWRCSLSLSLLNKEECAVFTPTYHERNLNNLSKLAPNTKKAAMEWYNWCVANGIDILIYETIRTEEKQRYYVASGKSKTTKSYHLVGQALDFVPIVNGKTDWNGYNRPEIKKAIAKAKQLGFEWGGDLVGAWDKPHLQYNYKGYGTDKEPETKKVTNDPAASKTKPKQKDSSDAIVPYPGKPLKLGSKGKDVERIQRALKLKVSGIFDKQTEAEVKAYQKRKGLTADGIIGPKTWNMLF